MNKLLKRIINKLLSFVGLSVIKSESLALKDKELVLKTQLIDLYTNVENLKNSEPSVEVVVFSMDRALQLHALVSSYLELMISPKPMYVFYRATSAEHEKAYKEVGELFKDNNVHLVKQTSKATFKPELIKIIEGLKANKIFFLVDDIVFKEKVDIDDLTKFDFKNFVPSIRMGDHLTESHVVRIEPQKLPTFLQVVSDPDKITWIWRDGEINWAYPLSVDGHLFLRKEILAFSNAIEFSTPSTYEARLNTFLQYFHNRYGISYKTTKIINLPLNRVTTEAQENYFGNIDTNFLLEKWNQGYQMDYRKLYGYLNKSPHEDIEISFIKRT